MERENDEWWKFREKFGSKNSKQRRKEGKEMIYTYSVAAMLIAVNFGP